MNKSGWLVALLVVGAGCAPSAGPSSLDYATRVRGCATSLACYQRDSMANCLRGFGAETLAHLSCFAAADGDCEAALRCVDATVTADPSCTESTSACEGTALVTCTPATGTAAAFRLRLDCAAEGEVCFADAGTAGCVVGSCTGSGVRCLDGDILRCDGGHEYRTVCGDGTTCDASVVGRCAAAGPACTTDRCDGSVLVVCDEGHEGRFDCADYGRTCGSTDLGVDCLATGTECDLGTFVEHCTGSVLEFCSPNGTLEQFDCGAHGFDGCAAPAHCVPRGLGIAGP